MWLAISVATAATLVGYFTDAPRSFRDIVHAEASLTVGPGSPSSPARPTVWRGWRASRSAPSCARGRAAGRDLGSGGLTVNYRDYRGEPRTSAKKAAELRRRGEQAGDCVACDLCVSVCPIGIDIREGPNFACINCGLCVDACDSVMESLSRPRGLIDYESWNNIERGREERPRFPAGPAEDRPADRRLLAMAAGMAIMFANRTSGSISCSTTATRSPRLSDGSVRNGYTIELLNKAAVPRAFDTRPRGPTSPWQSSAPARHAVTVPADGSEALRVTLTMVLRNTLTSASSPGTSPARRRSPPSTGS